MIYTYKPQGVCSYEMKIEVDGDIIKKVTIEGGWKHSRSIKIS